MMFSFPLIKILTERKSLKHMPVQKPINFPPVNTKYFGRKRVGKKTIEMKIIPVKNNNENLDQVIREEPKVGRNEIVKITNGQETKEMKYKKAKPLIESGEWRIS